MMVTIIARLLTLLMLILSFSGCARPTHSQILPGDLPGDPSEAIRQHLFEELLVRNADLTATDLRHLAAQPDFLKQLSFEPQQSTYFPEATVKLQLTDEEIQLLVKNGFVSVDHQRPYSFGSMYYAIYSHDLPVLITTDSILHALHRSFDDILMDMEQACFHAELTEVLADCQAELDKRATLRGSLADSYRDVDLYLTVAMNLSRGAGGGDWPDGLYLASSFDQDREALDLLLAIKALEPRFDPPTTIYGGQRGVDFSQFRPRGHYTKSPLLGSYFRLLMWLSRADTGWIILPPDPQSGIVCDSRRELRNAVLFVELLQATGGLERLQHLDRILEFMIGESDNLNVFELANVMKRQSISGLDDLKSDAQVDALQDVLRSFDYSTQRIRSQLVLSDPEDLYQPPPPRLFQVLGQRFTLDSFLLTNVVYDSIIADGRKVLRMMPTGLDVAYALGNDSALPLLDEELTDYPYASNLRSAREFADAHRPEFWQSSLYNIWLDALRMLGDDLTGQEHVPQAMRTSAWQRKQLQTQLASWAELRHDTVLYAKQGYTASVSCEYPTGYVEPYPGVFARVKVFAEESARRFQQFDLPDVGGASDAGQRQVTFLNRMAEIAAKLEMLAGKELAGEPFSDEDEAWLKRAVDDRVMGSGFTTYSGWYCDLFYAGKFSCGDWVPTVVDVHTDPNDGGHVLEQAVGSCNFLVMAIDQGDESMIYVGPSYSYYEFQQPASDRLTDDDWSFMLQRDRQPARPDWTSAFQAPALRRQSR